MCSQIERAAAGGRPPLLLDGALGTELERVGCETALPLWSAAALVTAPARVAAIHRAHAAAGAELLTTNTFRTQERTLARGGLGGRARELTRLAAELARAAAEEAPHETWVLGSCAPLEDCYRPDLVPDDAALEREHRAHAENLAASGVDALAIETLNSVREAVIAMCAARETGLPVLVSFVCDVEARLLSGEPLAAALTAVAEWQPFAVGVNCLPPEAVARCVPHLARSGLPFAAYANLGAPLPSGAFRSRDDTQPDAFAALAGRWATAGAAIVGGCCGTRPAHVRAMRAVLGGAPTAERRGARTGSSHTVRGEG